MLSSHQLVPIQELLAFKLTGNNCYSEARATAAGRHMIEMRSSAVLLWWQPALYVTHPPEVSRTLCSNIISSSASIKYPSLH